MKGHWNDKLIRRSLNTTNWQIASQKVAQIEAAGSVEALADPIPIAEATANFLRELEARELREATLRKFRVLLSRMPEPSETVDRFSPSLVRYASEHNLVGLHELTPDHLANFRQQWKDRGLSKLKKSERLKMFFRYAHDCGWIGKNPAAKLKAPKITVSGVVAFSNDELAKIMQSCKDERLKTFLLVLRYSGLAIADAVQLTADRLEGDHLILRRTKTGKSVRILLPSVVVERLKALPALGGDYIFWNRMGAHSDVQTATGNMRRSLRRVFKAAGIPSAHPHRFRHLFVREHLEQDVSIETIADLLGNSVKIIEKHYANWVASRQKKLDDAVMKVWNEAELDTYRLKADIKRDQSINSGFVWQDSG